MSFVTFLPRQLRIPARKGQTLLEIALGRGVEIRHACGGNCACTTCRVTVLQGGELLSPPDELEALRLEGLGADGSVRLACQAELVGEGEVVVRPLLPAAPGGPVAV